MFHREPDKASNELDDAIPLLYALLDSQWVNDSTPKRLPEALLPGEPHRLAVVGQGRNGGASKKEGVKSVDVLAM
jgi:hypothetical protein